MAEDTPVALAPEEETAQRLYSTYRLHVGGVNEAGVAMPPWEQLSVPLHTAWMAVQDAARGGGSAAAPSPSATAWTQEELTALTVTDLRDLASSAGVSVPSNATKQQLIDGLLASQGGTP